MIKDEIRALKKVDGNHQIGVQTKISSKKALPVCHQNFKKYVCFVALCLPFIFSDGITAIKCAISGCKTILVEVIFLCLICLPTVDSSL